MQTKKFICCRVNSLRKTAGTLAEKVRIKTGDFISNLACGTGEVPYTKVASAYNSGNAPTMSMLDKQMHLHLPMNMPLIFQMKNGFHSVGIR